MDKRKDTVLYQIYPKSFYDTNGDGIGDITGIVKKLPYLEKLGVDMIWISPFYPSPQKDNGYDISDYKAVDSAYGTLSDFQKLVREAAKRNIGIMLDMVLNHTSTDHIWFKKALDGDNYYKDFYFFKKGKSNGEAPTNWKSKFGNSAWEKIEKLNEYYLHLYDVTQADLNWDNPNVRKELYDIVNFWLEMGVKGLRFDVINVISKPENFEDDFEGDGRRFYTDGPNIHKYLKELNKNTFGSRDITTVGEMSSTSIKNCIKYSNPIEKELDMVFHFHHLKTDYPDGEKWALGEVDFEKLKTILHVWQEEMAKQNGWEALFWNNHDQPRALERFTSKDKKYHFQGATLLAATIHFFRGTPYIYYGEEIGMLNPDFSSISEYRDIETINYYKFLINKGLSVDDTMKIIKQRSRDNSRTPMQWADFEHADFTTGTPWISVNENYKHINVDKETSKTKSIFEFYQNLILLRKKYLVIQEGSYMPILLEYEKLIAYKRENETHILMSINNYSDLEREINIEKAIDTSFIPFFETIACNYIRNDFLSEKVILNPYETITFLFEK